MNRNILKLASMLCVGLALATSCSGKKDKDTEDKLKTALTAVKAVQTKVKAIDVSVFDDKDKVCAEAEKSFKDAIASAKKVTSDVVKDTKAIDAGVKNLEAYTVGTGTNETTEKEAAVKLIKALVDALEGAEKK